VLFRSDSAKKEELPPFKYLEIEVTRKEASTVFLKVPRDFDMNKIKRSGGRDSILSKACKKTISDLEWDDTGWEDDIEWESIKDVSEEEATIYQVYEVK
jgi:hypothetical protein